MEEYDDLEDFIYFDKDMLGYEIPGREFWTDEEKELHRLRKEVHRLREIEKDFIKEARTNVVMTYALACALLAVYAGDYTTINGFKNIWELGLVCALFAVFAYALVALANTIAFSFNAMTNPRKCTHLLLCPIYALIIILIARAG